MYRQSKVMSLVATGMSGNYLNLYVDSWQTIMSDLLNFVSVSSCMWMVNALWQTLQQMMVFGIPYVLCGILQMENGAFTLMQNLVIMEQVLQMEHSSQVKKNHLELLTGGVIFIFYFITPFFRILVVKFIPFIHQSCLEGTWHTNLILSIWKDGRKCIVNQCGSSSKQRCWIKICKWTSGIWDDDERNVLPCHSQQFNNMNYFNLVV